MLHRSLLDRPLPSGHEPVGSLARGAAGAAGLAAVVAALATACGGGASPAYRRVAAPAPAASSAYGGGDAAYGGGAYGDGARAPAEAAPGAEAPASDSAGAPYEPSPQPTQRPGLGTVWGETVDSRITMRPFTRATPSPFAAVALHYNDAEGVRAHAAYVGGAPSPYRAHTPHGGIEVMLTDAHGNVLPGGEYGGRTMIVGTAGQRYNLVVVNRTGGRYEVVASVDGLDVIDGKPGDLAKRGYILEPHATLTIDGFRQSETAVAAFRFGRVSDSYAARTSGDRNVGVIGAAFFAEQGSAWTTDELHRRDTANPFPGDRDYARPPGY